MPEPTLWEDEAKRWIAWARTPGHDVFSLYAPAFLTDILPPAPGLTLEIGCGEGRVARALAAIAHGVVALDAAPTLVASARAADARSSYLVADGTAVPFADGTFDTVVAYNSLQTTAEITDMAAIVREASRVLKPNGRFCFCVAHPMTDVGCAERSANGDLLMSGSYFEPYAVNETATHNGLAMTFHGWTHTLEGYVRALESAGFVIERLREPRGEPRGPVAAEAGTARPGLDLWQRLPLFLSIRAAKVPR